MFAFFHRVSVAPPYCDHTMVSDRQAARLRLTYWRTTSTVSDNLHTKREKQHTSKFYKGEVREGYLFFGTDASNG